ncbi:MAG: pitrilysin family protein [Hyphomonas oceanitis]|uniref:M16 family peptidase n=1 Tax=Hyphomonas oceanitis SCH89 TaxID=1280953 RepID=A0A059GAM2_9PROT|nr:pitrilysin family protein [Hyphomonas oceanitis]KDA03856.1 M16 family peptidase [Hyphomonas oceanitis SCH89]
MTYLKLMMGAASALVLTACASAPVTEAAPETLVEAPAAEPAMKVDVHKGDFVEIQQFVTPGGVSVWLVSEPSIPIVSVEMAWKGGETSDPEGLEGLSDAVVYNMNEGAGDLDSLGFQTRMEELNMSFGCSTGNDWTSCSASMLKENAPEAMGLIATAFDEPRFDEGPFERFQRENLIGIKQRETSAGWLARKAMTDALYPGHPYARQTSVESIAALTPELAREQMRKLMVKDRLLVTAVGAVTPEELAPMIDMALGGLPETSELPPVADITLPTPPAEPIVVDLPQPQSLVMFSAPGLERHDPDFFAAYVLNYTVGGGGFESRLMKTLRVDKGLTYGVSTGLSTSDHLDTWTGGGQTKNESAGEFLAGIHDELNLFVADGMTEEELSDAKAYLTGSYALGFDSNAKIADQIMSVRQQDLGIDYFDTRNANMNAVTLDDVNRVAKEYLSPENFIYVVVGEPEGVE